MAWPWDTKKKLEEQGYDVNHKAREAAAKSGYKRMMLEEHGSEIEAMADMIGCSVEDVMDEIWEHPVDYQFRLKIVAKLRRNARK